MAESATACISCCAFFCAAWALIIVYSSGGAGCGRLQICACCGLAAEVMAELCDSNNWTWLDCVTNRAMDWLWTVCCAGCCGVNSIVWLPGVSGCADCFGFCCAAACAGECFNTGALAGRGGGNYACIPWMAEGSDILACIWISAGASILWCSLCGTGCSRGSGFCERVSRCSKCCCYGCVCLDAWEGLIPSLESIMICWIICSRRIRRSRCWKTVRNPLGFKNCSVMVLECYGIFVQKIEMNKIERWINRTFIKDIVSAEC